MLDALAYIEIYRQRGKRANAYTASCIFLNAGAALSPAAAAHSVVALHVLVKLNQCIFFCYCLLLSAAAQDY